MNNPIINIQGVNINQSNKHIFKNITLQISKGAFLYIIGETDSGWVSILETGGPVHMRLEDSTYPLLATMVTSNEDKILQAWQEKYEADYPEFFASSASDDFLEYSSVYRLSRI